jgi:hypothetical protein
MKILAFHSMKVPGHHFVAVTVVIVTVLGCVTPRTETSSATAKQIDDLKARIDAAVNDRRNWVDPASGF